MDENESSWNLNDVAIGVTERKEEQGAKNDAATVASLGRQVMLPSSSPICISDPGTSHIKLYSFYEIDQTKLPVNAPLHLKSIRILMVTDKSKTRVVVRYPSVNSLRLHLSGERGVKRVPSLDEKYFMEPEVAGEVLYRRVSGDEIGENNNFWSFWVVACDDKNKGVCWSELLASHEMVKWGKRKKLHYLNNEGASIRYDGGYEEEDEEEAVNAGECKRKRHDVNELSKKNKKKKVVKNSDSRWPKQRYKLAEMNMLKILKKKNAVYGNPILRPELRVEARKLIGDTGLLDHLLKHMSGKVAPGGQDRFRRRHNADGAMEYWLESAELVNIRKQAGVEDPYWTPLPGWKPGDNPVQNPVCAGEFKQLKEDMAKLRLEMQDLMSTRQADNLAIVTTPSLSVEHDGFLLGMKEMYSDLMKKKAKLEVQMMEISQSLCRLEEEMEKRKSAVEEQNEPAESAPTSDEKPGCIHKITTVPPETTEVTPEDRASKLKRLKSGFRICKPQGSFLWPNMAMSPQPNKALAHLDDHFLVLTPPSVSSSTASSSPHHFLSPLSKSGPLPNCPVKPLPERRPVTVTLSAAATRPTHPPPPETITQFETITSTSIITTATSSRTSVIDLNEMPCPHTYQRRNQNWSTTNTTIPCLGAAEKDAKIRQRNDDERKELQRECDQKQSGSSSSVSSSSSSACLTSIYGSCLASFNNS